MDPFYYTYVLVLCGVPICFVDDEKLRRQLQFVYFSFILTFLVLFGGLRGPFVDRDYANYLQWFNDIAHRDAEVSQWLWDPPFSVISYLVMSVGWPFFAVTLIFSALSLSLKWYFASKVVGNRWLTLFFYLIFCRFYIVSDLTEIRVSVAIPLMAMSIYLACMARRRAAVAVYLLSAAFHLSMLLVLPVFVLLIAGVKFRSRLWVIALAPLAFVTWLKLQSLFDSVAVIYRVGRFLAPNSAHDELTLESLYFAMLVFPAAVGAFFAWEKLSLHHRVAVFCSALGVSVFVVLISNTVLASRCVNVFEIYQTMLYVVFMQLLRGYKRLIYVALLVVMGFGEFIKEFNLVNRYTVVDPVSILKNPSVFLLIAALVLALVYICAGLLNRSVNLSLRMRVGLPFPRIRVKSDLLLLKIASNRGVGPG
ncbi:MAG TPA: EpsG family protein [Terracidiphilus sp.]